MTCCEDQQPLQLPPPQFILSISAPPFYPSASAPHYHPPVCDLIELTMTSVQPSTTSSPLMPSGLFPPVTVTQPPPPLDPPDLSVSRVVTLHRTIHVPGASEPVTSI